MLKALRQDRDEYRAYQSHLTPERRLEFERMGEAQVRNALYEDHAQRMASWAWLAEKRIKRKLISLLMILATFATIAGLATWLSN